MQSDRIEQDGKNALGGKESECIDATGIELPGKGICKKGGETMNDISVKESDKMINKRLSLEKQNLSAIVRGKAAVGHDSYHARLVRGSINKGSQGYKTGIRSLLKDDVYVTSALGVKESRILPTQEQIQRVGSDYDSTKGVLVIDRIMSALDNLVSSATKHYLIEHPGKSPWVINGHDLLESYGIYYDPDTRYFHKREIEFSLPNGANDGSTDYKSNYFFSSLFTHMTVKGELELNIPQNIESGQTYIRPIDESGAIAKVNGVPYTSDDLTVTFDKSNIYSSMAEFTNKLPVDYDDYNLLFEFIMITYLLEFSLKVDAVDSRNQQAIGSDVVQNLMFAIVKMGMTASGESWSRLTLDYQTMYRVWILYYLLGRYDYNKSVNKLFFSFSTASNVFNNGAIITDTSLAFKVMRTKDNTDDFTLYTPDAVVAKKEQYRNMMLYPIDLTVDKVTSGIPFFEDHELLIKRLGSTTKPEYVIFDVGGNGTNIYGGTTVHTYCKTCLHYGDNFDNYDVSLVADGYRAVATIYDTSGYYRVFNPNPSAIDSKELSISNLFADDSGDSDQYSENLSLTMRALTDFPTGVSNTMWCGKTVNSSLKQTIINSLRAEMRPEPLQTAISWEDGLRINTAFWSDSSNLKLTLPVSNIVSKPLLLDRPSFCASITFKTAEQASSFVTHMSADYGKVSGDYNSPLRVEFVFFSNTGVQVVLAQRNQITSTIVDDDPTTVLLRLPYFGTHNTSDDMLDDNDESMPQYDWSYPTSHFVDLAASMRGFIGLRLMADKYHVVDDFDYEIMGFGDYSSVSLEVDNLVKNFNLSSSSVKKSFNKRYGYFDGSLWNCAPYFPLTVRAANVNYAFTAPSATEDQKNSRYNAIKSLININAIKAAFALNRTYEYSKLLKVIGAINKDIDPVILSQVFSSTKQLRLARGITEINVITDAIATDLPDDYNVDDDPASADNESQFSNYINEIESRDIVVDKDYIVTRSDIDANQITYNEKGQPSIKFRDYFANIKFKDLACDNPEVYGITAPDDKVIFDYFKSLHENDTMAEIIAYYNTLPEESNEAKFYSAVLKHNLSSLSNEVSTLTGGIMDDLSQDAISALLDNEDIYSSDNEAAISSNIDTIIKTVSDALMSEGSEALTQMTTGLKGIANNACGYVNGIITNANDHFKSLVQETRARAIDYYRVARDKVAADSEALSSLLSFKLSSLVQTVLTYGDGIKDYLYSLIGVRSTKASSFGWQDSSFFTPLSNISLLTGVVDVSSLAGVLSAGVAFVNKVITGGLSLVKGAVVASFGDGLSIRRRLNGYETLDVQCAHKVISREFMNSEYTWLYDKLANYLTGTNSSYVSCCIGNMLLFMQDYDVSRVMITANPVIKLKDDTDNNNDYSIFSNIADSIMAAISDYNALITACIDAGILDQPAFYLQGYDVHRMKKMILDRAVEKSAATVVGIKTGILAVGALIGGLLLFTGVGTAVGTAIIAGTTVAGMAMVGSAENQTKEEHLLDDDAYANNLIKSSDFADLWCGSISPDIIDVYLRILDRLSLCKIDHNTLYDKPFYELVHVGIGDALDMSDYSADDLPGYIPLIVQSGTPRFKYHLISDWERAIRGAVGIVATVTAGVFLVVKTVSASIKKSMRKKLWKTQADQWEPYPSKDDAKYEGMTDEEKEQAYRRDCTRYSKNQYRMSRKVFKLDNALSNIDTIVPSGSDVASLLSTAGTSFNYTDPLLTISDNLSNDVDSTNSHVDEMADAIGLVSNKIGDVSDGSSVVSLINASSGNSTNPAIMSTVIIGALAVALGVSTTVLIKRLKRALSSGPSLSGV